MAKIVLRTFLLLLVFIPFNSNSQAWQWVTSAGGTSSDKALDMDIDKYGNQYVCGYYNSLWSGGASFGSIVPINHFGKDGFIAKVDSVGTWQWVREIIGGYDERVLGLCVDRINDFIYFTGTTWNHATFGGCPAPSFYGGRDNIFIGKSDLNGNCQWFLPAGGYSDDHGYDLATDNSGNVYFTGFVSNNGGADTAMFGSIKIYVPWGDSLGFISKISPAGVFQWVRTFQATDGERDNRIAVDENGNSFVTGGFWGTKPFGPVTATSNGGTDIFVIKYDTGGNFMWLRTTGSTLDDRGNAISMGSDNKIYLIGEFRDRVGFGTDSINNNGGPGGRDLFVAKIDQIGNWDWAKKAGSDAGSDRGNRIAANKQDLLFVTGQFNGLASFGSADTLSNGMDSIQIFVAAIDTTGKWHWAIQAGSSIEDRGTGIAVDDSCNVFTCGYYELTASFDAMNLTSLGRKDIYVAKIPGACVYNTVGIAENSSEMDPRFYPNPTNGKLTIDLGKNYNELRLEVYNVVGELVLSSKHGSTDKIELNIEHADGLYFVHLIPKDETPVVLKVIKSN